MQKMIVVQPSLCAGCRLCEVVCSTVHYGVCSPARSNIRVVEWQDKGISVPFTCLQCESAICMENCPAKAITRDEKSGAMIIAEELCLGCRMCVLTCPFGGPRVSLDTGRVVKCDLCGGDPQCVSNCPTKAIKFMDVNEFIMEKMKASATGLVNEELKQIAEMNKNK